MPDDAQTIQEEVLETLVFVYISEKMLFDKFTYIIKKNIFTVLMFFLIGWTVVLIIALCVNFDFKKLGEKEFWYDPYKPIGTWVMIDSPYSLLKIREDSVFLKTDTVTISKKIEFVDKEILLSKDKESIRGKFCATRGLTIGGIIITLNLKGLGAFDGTYIGRGEEHNNNK